MEEVELLLGFHKVCTTTCHPQNDGLIERFDHSLLFWLRSWREEEEIEVTVSLTSSVPIR